jgi:hypothetical protein
MWQRITQTPFDNGYLLERLTDSVWLTDDNTQWMIASV